MTDPTLKRTYVKIGHTASDGYRAEFSATGGVGTRNRITGQEVPPEKVLFESIRELSRLSALFGFEAGARAAFDEAAAAVNEWRKDRT